MAAASSAEAEIVPVDAGGESWKDADFLSLDNGTEEDDSVEEQDQEFPSREQPQGIAVPTYVSRSQQRPPWMDQNPGDFSLRLNPLVALHNEIVGFCQLMEPLPEERRERNVLVDEVRKLAYSVFGEQKCQVEVFGSQATGLLLPSSDVDIVIMLEKEEKEDAKESGDSKSQEQAEMDAWDEPTESPLRRLAYELRHQWKGDLSYLEVIENTRVPIIKLTHAPSDISVDICFNQENGIKAANLMKYYLEEMPPLRPLTFVLKYFLAARSINEPYSGGVGSFMLQLMIVSFLQYRQRDQQNYSRHFVPNLGCLLLEFFELYGIDFNYVTTGISVLKGGYYFPKGAKDRKETFWQPSRPFSLAIESPLDALVDVGSSSFRMQMVQRSFEVAFKVLLAHVTNPMIPALSILASILPPSKEMKQRATFKKVDATLSRPLSSDRRQAFQSRRNSSDMETSSGDDTPVKRHRFR